jgi:mRNA interferase MazF
MNKHKGIKLVKFEKKDYVTWTSLKRRLHNDGKRVYFKERDIFWASIGENIGFEEDGKHAKFHRPVLIFRKFNDYFFLGIPLSTTSRRGKYYFPFTVGKKVSVAVLSQIRAFDSMRLGDKIGMVSARDYGLIKQKLADIILG